MLTLHAPRESCVIELLHHPRLLLAISSSLKINIDGIFQIEKEKTRNLHVFLVWLEK
jgi:hypothetical protein